MLRSCASIRRIIGVATRGGDELILVVEVSDSTAAFDLSRKAELYANAGVPEYWVVDLNRRVVVAQREARNGIYRVAQSFVEGEVVPVPGHEQGIPVDEIFA